GHDACDRDRLVAARPAPALHAGGVYAPFRWTGRRRPRAGHLLHRPGPGAHGGVRTARIAPGGRRRRGERGLALHGFGSPAAARPGSADPPTPLPPCALDTTQGY